MSRIPAMRGMRCAISSGADGRGPAGITVGYDEQDGEGRFVIALRHADGTILAAHLEVSGLNRLGGILADLVEFTTPLGTNQVIH